MAKSVFVGRSKSNATVAVIDSYHIAEGGYQ